jgi:hypothetical protein
MGEESIEFALDDDGDYLPEILVYLSVGKRFRLVVLQDPLPDGTPYKEKLQALDLDADE